jgi:DNA transposition AAA+ family ATPase
MIESKIFNVYDNKYLKKGAYYIVYGVKGAGKTSAVMHVLGNKPGVVMVRISENDTNETIINKIFMECGTIVNSVADLKKITTMAINVFVKYKG